MRLSQLPVLKSSGVLRDAEFSTIGLTFYDLNEMLVCLYDPRYLSECRRNTGISCVVTTTALAPQLRDDVGVAVSSDPRALFHDVHRYLREETVFFGTPFETELADGALVHPRATVAERNVRVGPGVCIEAGVVIHEGVTLGDDVVIRAGAVLGAEGFSPVAEKVGYRNVTHTGTLRVDTGVEIQSNAVVCRGAYSGQTLVGAGSILSALVNVSHNVRVGERCRIGTGACLLGSTRIGPDAWVGPHASIANRVSVGARARVTLGAVVVRDVPNGETVTGYFAVPHEEFLASFRRRRRARGRA